MAEYIERSDAIEAAQHAWEKGLEPSQYIDLLPAADVAPVVRCKDCCSYNKPRIGFCEVHLDREHPDDYCSYGKRITEGGADDGGK